MAFVAGAMRWYMGGLKSHPILFKSATGLTAAGTGDVVAQHVEARAAGTTLQAVDVGRVVAFATYGCMWTGPFNHQWLPVVQRIPSVWGKLAAQHMVVNPLVYLPTFFGWTALWQGKSRAETLAYAKDRIPTAYAGSLAFWVPVTAVIFTRVPERLQSVSMAGINLVWNSLLSLMANSRR